MRLCTSSKAPRRLIIFVFSSPEQQRKFADPESGQKRSGQLRRGGVSLMPASSAVRLQGEEGCNRTRVRRDFRGIYSRRLSFQFRKARRKLASTSSLFVDAFGPRC